MKNILIIIGVVIVGALGLMYSTSNEVGEKITENESATESMMENEDNMMTEGDSMMVEEGEKMMEAGSYEVYTTEKLAKASTGDVVLFFKANWCPTCRVLDADIRANLSEIPEDLTILDVDYDNSSELKKKYGVTYQHTLVQVDENGNMLKKWSGSPTLATLAAEVK